MPELPEVETIRRQLAPQLEGRDDRRRARSSTPAGRGPSRPAAVEERLRGARSSSGRARSGKYLVWELSGDRHLLDAPADDRERCCSTRRSSRRTRGCASSSTTATGSCTSIRAGSGPATCCHGAAARDAYLRRAARGRADDPRVHRRASARARRAAARAPVKAFLLDQRRIAGVGNIYADEALFRAGIHPLRPAGRADRAAVRRGCATRSRRRCWPGSRPRARRSTTSATSTAPGAPSRTASSSTAARASRARSAARPIRKLVVGGRGTYVCEHCQPRPRRAARAEVADPAATRLRGEQLGRRPARSAASSSSKPPSGSLADHDLREREHPGRAEPARPDRPGRVPD